MHKIAIGADHAGYEYKELLRSYLEKAGYEVEDKGTYSGDPADYPDFAHAVADAVASGASDGGILICGSANGVAMAANRHAGARAAVSWTEEIASLARRHNNANILCIPARFVDTELAYGMAEVFLKTAFEGGRHGRRVEKIEC
jgi:ribose 5-phosphate isomerase B